MVQMVSYYAAGAIGFIAIALAGLYAWKVKNQLCCKECEMHGMMLGMTFGMMAGLVTSTVIVVPTGDFFTATISGTLAGAAAGVFMGRTFGGSLGRMEGVMAGPMGGMMGAMLGQMIRPFNLQLFMPFFFAVVVFVMAEMCYVVYKQTKVKAPTLAALGLVFVLLAGVSSFFLDFSLQGKTTSLATLSASTGSTGGLAKYKWLSEITKETRETAKLNADGAQEVAINATFTNYEPNVVVAKKGVPLEITLTADEDAGCGRDVVFPEFGKDVIIPSNSSTTVTLDLEEAGEFRFHCSMDMFQGKIIVQD